MTYEQEEKLRLALLRILNFNNLRLFGCLIYNFLIQIIKTPEKNEYSTPAIDSLTAFATIKDQKPIIGIFDKFLDEKNEEELIFIILHEVLHILNGHIYRGQNKDRLVYNIAADHVINTALQKDIQKKIITKVQVPNDAIIIESLKSQNLTVEEVYDWLKKNASIEIYTDMSQEYEISQQSSSSATENKNQAASNQEETKENLTSDQSQQKSPETDSPQDTSSNETKNEKSNESTPNTENQTEKESNPIKLEETENPKSQNQSVGTGSSCQTKESGSTQSSNQRSSSPDTQRETNPEDQFKVKSGRIKINNQEFDFIEDLLEHQNSSPHEEEQMTKALHAEVRALMNDERISRGLVSGAIKELIEKIIEVAFPWEKVLPRVLLTKMVPKQDTRIWVRPHKRLRSHGLVLPGPGYEKKPSCAILCLDTSGSIGLNDLRMFSSIILQFLSKFDEIRIIKHDVKVHSDNTIKMSDLNYEQVAFTFSGRGGTSHTPVFDLIEEAFNHKADIGIVICLTDFYSNIHKIYHDYKWIKKIPICICVTAGNKSVMKKIPQDLDPSPIYIEPKS